ncbi:DUF1345 domain-containing protein [Sphingorhabdus sp.]|uniref:DUF1345 domain-containing protein n=1 Tax=Sphingorhabdus sp. TaxID=1902408 RepID=UPI003983041D
MAGKAPASAIMPWRYGLFLLLCLSATGFGVWLPWYQAVMAGFDVAALGYAATLRPLFRLDAAGIRKQAKPEDTDRILLLALTAVTMVTILTAVATELTKSEASSHLSVALVIVTLAIAWCFSNMIYAIHYAHLFYDDSRGGGDRGGVEFPKTKSPDYWDFVYFAYTLGMTFQTSDVAITDGQWRKVVIFHSIAAFVFNIGVIAFSINILAS